MNNSTLSTLRIISINVNKSLAAQNYVLNTTDPKDVDIILVQEPYSDWLGSRGTPA